MAMECLMREINEIDDKAVLNKDTIIISKNKVIK